MTIRDAWWPQIARHFGWSELPRNYITADLRTTGRRMDDLIAEVA